MLFVTLLCWSTCTPGKAPGQSLIAIIWAAICVKSVILAWIYISDGRYTISDGRYTYRTGDIQYKTGHIHIGQEIYISDREYTYRTGRLHTRQET